MSKRGRSADDRLKRLVDITAAGAVLIVAAAPMMLLALLIRTTSNGPALHWSRRVGRGNRMFWMPKFRTMRIEAPQLATHLMTDADRWITPVGAVLRRSSLDELPQLWSVLIGQMSLVGPRPALFNQQDLVDLRTRAGVHALRPGLTGWAQVNGRDELTIHEKVRLDEEYMEQSSFMFDLRIIVLTAWRVLGRQGVGR